MALKTVLTRDLSEHRIADRVSTIRYLWKDKKRGTVPRFGYIAQELLLLIPEAVYKPDGHITNAVDYTQVHTLLLDECIKRIQVLEKRIDSMQNNSEI